MEKAFRKTGIDIIGDAPWGTHLCQFYETREDLVDILVPYFKAGLENNEFCMWITSEPLKVEDAKAALKKVVKNLDHFIKKGQIEILDYSEWYTKSGKFDANNVLQGWVEKENQALKRGYDGLRLSGNTFWLGKRDWRNFTDYEEEVNNVIGKYRMIAICTYSLGKCGASEVIDVISNHQFALIRREGKWVIIESSERKRAEEALRESEERLATDLEATTRLQGIRALFLRGSGMQMVLDEIVEAAIAIAGADMGNIQLLDPQSGNLKIMAHRGFEQSWLDFWDRVYPGQGTCGTALEGGERVIVEDITQSPIFVGTPALDVQLVAGVRAVQSTPLLSRSGRLLGVFSTHFRTPHRPDERALRLLDLLARQTTDIIERAQTEEALRESEEKYHTLFEGSRDAISITTREGKFIDINQAWLELLGYTREELMSLNVQETYANPDDRPRVQKEIERKGFVRDYEIKLRKKDGTAIDSLLTFTVWRAYNGEFLGYQGIIRDITEHKREEDQILRQSAVLDGISKVFRQALICKTEEELSSKSLTVAEELTGSKFGWIGEINQEGRLDAIALSDPGWNECRMSKSDAVIMIKDMEIRGIWGEVLKDEQSLIVNDPPSHPDSVGTPEGHPPITAFLGVPLKQAGKTFGMIALANKESGYDLPDQEAVETLSVAIAEALKRKRAEEALIKSELRFRNCFDLPLIGFAITSPEKGWIEVNDRICSILGYFSRRNRSKDMVRIDTPR